MVEGPFSEEELITGHDEFLSGSVRMQVKAEFLGHNMTDRLETRSLPVRFRRYGQKSSRRTFNKIAYINLTVVIRFVGGNHAN